MYARVCTRICVSLYIKYILYIYVLYYIILFFFFYVVFLFTLSPVYLFNTLVYVAPFQRHVSSPFVSYYNNKQNNTTNENRKIINIFVGCEFSVRVFCCLRWRWSVVECPCLDFCVSCVVTN